MTDSSQLSDFYSNADVGADNPLGAMQVKGQLIEASKPWYQKPADVTLVAGIVVALVVIVVAIRMVRRRNIS